MEKILFVDFDGVLHPTTCSSELLFSKALALSELLSVHPCKVVISSSWRFHHELDEIKSFLPIKIANLICGTTGDAHMGKWPRYNEIKNYMIDQRIFADWRALDDSFLEFPKYCQELILCHGNDGLTEKQLLKLSTWLLS